MRKRMLVAIVCIMATVYAVPANDDDRRMELDPRLAPFYHGVASGDPLQDAVILWTRVTTEEAQAEVLWEIATSANFGSDIVASGSTSTSADKDYTIKVDATGLASNTFYYYRFNYDGDYSMVGRTKTAPTADEVDQLRFATVSCSNWQHGYFNAYNRITERNDIDAVLHLGDYIYEYGPGEYGDERPHDPPYEMVELGDYRTRYAQYRLDPALRDIHQQYPFITTWDDHESADNSWRHGAENHQASEGDWEERLTSAAQAYSEWLPIRLPDPDDAKKIYRSFNYGNLAEIFVLDTRIIGRDEQLDFLSALDPNNANDPDRQLLGEAQLSWLEDGLVNSTAQWKVLMQQVMVGPFKVFGLVLNSDQWDGYGGERARVFDIIESNEIDNIVVLTGDIHTTWAMDLPFASEPYDPVTGANSLGVEFVTTSVTSPGFPIGFVDGVLYNNNKHMKYIQLTLRGFGLLDLSADKAQNDIYFTGSVSDLNNYIDYRVGFFTEDGANTLQQTYERTESIYEPAEPAPDPFDDIPTPVTVGNVEVTGIYPNPLSGSVLQVQYFVQEDADIDLEIYDVGGQVRYSEKLGQKPRGIYMHSTRIPDLATGTYMLVIRQGDAIASQKLIKAN